MYPSSLSNTPFIFINKKQTSSIQCPFSGLLLSPHNMDKMYRRAKFYLPVVPIPIQVRPTIIIKNNDYVSKVLFILEHLKSVMVLFLKGASEGEKR